MKSFFVGLLVTALILLFSIIAVMLLPLFIVLGFFLKIVIGALVVIFCIWLIGRVTLWAIDYMKDKK